MRIPGMIGLVVALGLPGPVALAQVDLDELLADAEPAPTPAAEQEAEQEDDGEDEKEPSAEASGQPVEPAAEAAATGPEPATAEAAPRPAVTPPPPRVLEEIIVTAQKTEQSLHDVPISMSVFDGEYLNQQSVTDLSELSQHVPNVKVQPAAFVTQVRMRGFGIEEANKGLEAPVGLTIDGVSYGNQTYLQTGFFDLARIEVLRGPQNTLFGKNNSVGLFNMTTQNPTDDLTGFLDLEYGEAGRRRMEAAVGGAVVPGFLNVRLAGMLDEREGFVRNTTAAVEPEAFRDMVGRNRHAFRVKAGLPSLFGADVVLSYERFDLEVLGTGFEFALVPEGTRAFFEAFDPDTDFIPGNFVASTEFPSKATLQIDTFVANAGYDLGPWGLDAVVGHSVLRLDNEVDGDTGPAPIIFAATKDTNPQTTFELRATSPSFGGFLGLDGLFGRTLGSSDFTAGIFYQRRLVRDSEFTAAFDTLLIGSAVLLGNFPPPVGIPTPDEPVAPDQAGEQVEETTLFWRQTSDAIAGFGHLNWRFADRWTLTGGLRLGNEWKEADWERVFSGSPPVFLNAGGFEEFTAHRARSEFDITPRVNLRYDVTDDINVFGTWAQGLRGGGFNEFATSAANLDFDPERTTNWELGTNMDLLGGVARLGLVFYWMNITDFQLLTDDPDTGFNEIKNAGEARARGVEADGTWLATDWLTIRGSLGLNDSEYLDFPFGPCVGDRGDTDGDGDDRCDLTGGPLHQTPKWVATLVPTVSLPLAGMPGFGGLLPLLGGVDLVAGITFEYSDTQLLDPSLDPRTREGKFFRFDGNLGFRDVGRGWSLRVTMENLTDETIADSARQVSLFNGHFIRGYEAPRHVFGELRWSF